MEEQENFKLLHNFIWKLGKHVTVYVFFVSKVVNPVNEALCQKQNQCGPLLMPKSSLQWWSQVNINSGNKKYNKIILSMFDGALDFLYIDI